MTVADPREGAGGLGPPALDKTSHKNGRHAAPQVSRVIAPPPPGQISGSATA